MYSDLVRVIKKVALEAVANSEPMEVKTGTVTSINPIHIRADDKIEYMEENGDLILTHLVRDYTVDITVQHSTDSIFGSWDTSHSHPDAGISSIPIKHEHEYKGRKKIIVHNKLVVDEKVILIKLTGGQKVIVLDRINDPTDVKGEWI